MEGNYLFKDFFKTLTPVLEEDYAVATPQKENLADNRMFVWAFNRDNLNDFKQIMYPYKNRMSSYEARRNLKELLLRKMREMLKNGDNPVECMLYASKVINRSLGMETGLQKLLGELIYDIYLVEREDTKEVIKNIFKMWNWTPQIKAVIFAVGMIGSDEELMDLMMHYYSDMSEYKRIVYYALKEHYSTENTKRIVKIISKLSDNDEDVMIGKDYQKEVDGLNEDDIMIIREAADSPGIKKVGRVYLTNILMRTRYGDNDNFKAPVEDDFYRRNLARRSSKDDASYKEFESYCYEKYDKDAFYLARFSKPRIGDFLKHAIEDPAVPHNSKGVAIVSMGLLDLKGYQKAAEVLSYCRKNLNDTHEQYILVAELFLNRLGPAEEIADYLAKKNANALGDLYAALRNSNIIGYETNALPLLQNALDRKFNDLCKSDQEDELLQFVKNLQLFWDKKLYKLISIPTKRKMASLLHQQAVKGNKMDAGILKCMIEIVTKNYNAEVEDALLALLNAEHTDYSVQLLCHRKLNEREVTAPKAV